jgi:hypothetical protein
LKSKESTPNPYANKEDDTATTQYDRRVRTSFIGFVNDVAFVCNPEVDQLQKQKSHKNDSINQNCIHTRKEKGLSSYIKTKAAQ